ncbi:MAG: flagellar basal-body rod protein FlgG [Bacteroidetes bacterium]|jgi:flagellar basal-body rod protein FlgG|nr:flagellar basal-body rod protein FlgG [Bacteroidota bacterium]
MLRSLRTASLGMSAQQTGVDNIANNLANANTTSFKRSTMVFHDLLYQTIQTSGTDGEGRNTAPASLQMGHGAAAISTVRNHQQGGFVETGNSLDLAINGDGFFQVRTADGDLAFTRDGTFTINSDGMVVTQNGAELDPDIAIPPETVEIYVNEQGMISARLQGEVAPVDLGQIEMARFFNPGGLRSMGGNLYEQTVASGEPEIGVGGEQGFGRIRQGFLESSNVDVVQEMVNLISAQRAYEINSKMVSTSEEMLQVTNNLKR